MLEEPKLVGDVIRLARADEVTLLPAIERRAATVFRSVGLDLVAALEPQAEAFFAERQRANRLWVAVSDDVVVGFAAVDAVDDEAYLSEIDVEPAHQGRGLGRQLIEQVLLWALARQYPRLVLRTFRDVPWNGPFYERLAFVPWTPSCEAFADLVDAEAELGLPIERRAFYCRDLTPNALAPWGWNELFARQLPELDADELTPGRVVRELRGWVDVMTASGRVAARVAGRLKRSERSAEVPAIGDWVLLRLPKAPGEGARVERIFERLSRFSRKTAGARTEEQVVAANIDRLFLVMGLDNDYSPRRLERYLLTARESGAEAVVVLNKVDLASDLDRQVAEIRGIAGDAQVLLVSARSGLGLDQLRATLAPRQTVALVGSSGVGKSTLVNRLYGRQIMATRKVRAADDTGQHTTTHRELIQLPDGALLIDNPGIRELQLWDVDEALDATFDDIAELAERCRFRDCGHDNEPGCAVGEAVASGQLSAARVEGWRKMLAELAALERRQEQLQRLEEKRKWRGIHKAMRHFKPRSL